MSTTGLRLTCLDQLILASEQLDQKDSANGRMAHILTDNAVELMLHYQAERTLPDKGCYPEIRQLSKNEEADYLGRNFKPKVKLARKLGVIGDEEAEFILINHEYRNEVYHAGLRHEPVIWDLAWHYHSFACSLLPKIKMGLGHSYRLEKEVSPRLKRFVSTESELVRGDFGAKFTAICNSVGAKVTNPKELLSTVVGQALSHDVKNVDDALNFIEKYDGKALSRNEIIVETQLWSAMFDEERRNKCTRKPCVKSVEELQRAGITDPVAILGMFLQPPITEDPIGRWQKRIVSLRAEKTALRALKKYHTLRTEMNDLCEAVFRTASGLSNHLDYLRGK